MSTSFKQPEALESRGNSRKEEEELELYIDTLCSEAKQASRVLSKSSTAVKNNFLEILASELIEKENIHEIVSANGKDIQNGRENNLSKAMLDRLMLDAKRLASLASYVKSLIALEDPIAELIAGKRLRNGLYLMKKRVPLGVGFVIFESRPNVSIDIAALFIKSGNVGILRGGKEAFHSNMALHKCIEKALKKAGLPRACINMLAFQERALVKTLLGKEKFIDFVVPRGGASLISMVREHSKIPVIFHDRGVCSVYIDESAKTEMAIDIVLNAKTQRPGVCNAIENVYIHSGFSGSQKLLLALQEAGVELRGCSKTLERYTNKSEGISISLAREEDWHEEYLDLIVAVKTVDDMDEAIAMIHTYGSAHTDAIISESLERVRLFEETVDTACVVINASPRFHDGSCFDMGCEVGISNQKLHVRGPMGLPDLCSYKYVLEGKGDIRHT